MRILKKFIQKHSMRILGVPADSFNYRKDGLFTSHNVEFLEDPKFQKAYKKGEATGSYKGIEWRIHIACWYAQHVSKLEGDFVECGVHLGGTSLAVMDYIDFDKLGKTFYLFDTFEGLPEEYISDVEKEKGFHLNRWGYHDCYEKVSDTFKHHNVQLVKGKVPDSLNTESFDKVAYLHIDMNAAYPEVEALKYFWPKMVKGGIIILDDYGWMFHIEQKRAIDKFTKPLGIEILMLPTGQGIIMK